jgi:hypothetical protein
MHPPLLLLMSQRQRLNVLSVDKKVFTVAKRSITHSKPKLVVDLTNLRILCTAYGHGKEHDFHLFKASKVHLSKQTKVLADKGYQGLQKLHPNSQIPIKKPKGGSLSADDKRFNRLLARQRIIIEHVNRRLKVFKILSERYRNRRRRFGLRCNLIAAIYNFELSLVQGGSSKVTLASLG